MMHIEENVGISIYKYKIISTNSLATKLLAQIV